MAGSTTIVRGAKNYFGIPVIIAFCLVQLFLDGCENKVLPPQNNSPPITYIDEPIVLEISDTIPAFLNNRPDFAFNLSEVPLVVNGSYNEFYLIYTSPSSCDEDVLLYNEHNQVWDQISFAFENYLVCFDDLVDFAHLGSAQRLHFEDYLTSDSLVKLQGGIYEPRIQVVKISPAYYVIPTPTIRAYYGYSSVAFDGQALWLASRDYSHPSKIYELSLNGSVLGEFELATEALTGVAFGAGCLWLAGEGYNIYKMSIGGEIECSFDVPHQYGGAGGLAWVDNSLYFVNKVGIWPQAFVIDPFASCTTGQAVITDTVLLPRKQGHGLTSVGENLVFVSWDSLYTVSTAGEVLDALEIPVSYPTDAAWDGETIWILNRGPKDFPSADMFLSRFKLR